MYVLNLKKKKKKSPVNETAPFKKSALWLLLKTGQKLPLLPVCVTKAHISIGTFQAEQS